MNRVTLASYTLVCTAFVLTALVLLRASDLIDARAHADMVVNRNSVTMLSARFRADSEVLYVLDSTRERLFAYVHNPSKGSIEMLDSVDIGRAIQGGLDEGGPKKPGQPRRPAPR